jgi:hypothetical protein
MEQKIKDAGGTSLRVWLSVDWDFFQEERIEWDWSHRENPLFANVIWATRGTYMGNDIRPLTSPDQHEPRATGFWSRFAGACSTITLCVADSHAAGLPFFYQLGKNTGVPDEIWNYDAHHDLGYHQLSKLRSFTKKGIAEAGSWLYVLMKNYRKLRCRHIYPAWKDHTVEARPWQADSNISSRVTQVSAAHFKPPPKIEITGLFVAKSEAWSPPWNDKAFTRFIDEAQRELKVVTLPWMSTNQPANPLTERTWDDAAFFAYQKQVAEFRARPR